MMDARYRALAETLVGHSTKLRPGEKILVEAIDVDANLIVALVREIDRVGGIPLVSTKQNRVLRELYRTATRESMAASAAHEAVRMRGVDAYIGIRASHNICEYSDVSPEKLALQRKHWYQPVHAEIRVPRTRWVVLHFPTPAMAQQAEMSTAAFEAFYFRVCTADYPRMSRAMDPLKALMEATDRVRISGPGTDLSFSIKGMPAVKCDGDRNIPDGELFTAPVLDSVEGEILFNARTIYQGTTFSDVRLRFERGRAVSAEADKGERLRQILDTDEGARRVGEFSLSFNPYITRPMLDILFDEKIAGALHLAMGSAYDDCDNGNRSGIHWDLVQMQAPGQGGGRVWFDDRLVREDGRFVLPELAGLNPENLARTEEGSTAR